MTDYILTADAGGIAATGFGVPALLFGGHGSVSLGGQDATLRRIFAVEAEDLTLKLDRLNSTVSIVDAKGRPTAQFQRYWQRHCEAIETAFGNLLNFVFSIQAAYDAAAQANMAASNANNAVTQVQEVVEDVETTITAIENGDYNFDEITVGGTKFVNDGFGNLVSYA